MIEIALAFVAGLLTAALPLLVSPGRCKASNPEMTERFTPAPVQQRVPPASA